MLRRRPKSLALPLLLAILLASDPVLAGERQGWARRLTNKVAGMFRPGKASAPRGKRVSRPRRAGDVKVALPRNHVALEDGVKFLAARIKKELPEKKLQDHVVRLRHRKMSAAFGKLNKQLHRLDLEGIVQGGDAAVFTELKAVLEQVSARPAATWMTRLAIKYNQLKGTDQVKERKLAQGVLAVYRHMERKAGGAELKNSEIQQAWLKTFSGKLIQRAERRSAARLLPGELPALPASRHRKVSSLVKQARTHGGIRRQVSYLERQAAHLRGSRDEAERALGDRLVSYLAGYKASWSEAWLTSSMSRFQGTASPVTWNLNSDIQFKGKVSGTHQDRLKGDLAKAWKIIRGVVHPDILAKLPPVTVLVEHDRSRGAHNNDKIKLGPKSSLRTILHEFGHHIEDHAGVRPFAVAQSVRQQRANTNSLKSLNELVPGKNYKKDEKGYRGGFVAGYMGKHYSGGYTEIISMGLERFHSQKAARELFSQDGDMMLKVLTAIQNKP